MSDDNAQMSEAEFNRANFFTPDNEFQAMKRTDSRRRVREMAKRLRVIARALEAMEPRERYAAVRWIADRWKSDEPFADDGKKPPAGF